MRPGDGSENERKEENEGDSFLYRLSGSQCRCDRLMLSGAVSPTATLRIISIPCPSSRRCRLECAPGELKRDFAISKCFYARAQQQAEHNEYLRAFFILKNR